MPAPTDIAAYDFALPESLIATAPSPERDGCRLLALNRRTGEITHQHFRDLLRHLPENSVLVLNDAKVLKARLYATDDAGKRVELLFLRPTAPGANRWQALARGKSLKPGSRVCTAGGRELTLINLHNGCADVDSTRDIATLLTEEGEMPLPPYILKARTHQAMAALAPADDTQYQTVYAQTPGSVAAPTAGLHFTPELLSALEAKGLTIVRLTLHVGWGTFQPIRSAQIGDHHMHEEWFEITEAAAARVTAAKAKKLPVIAVGSTSVRALEAAWEKHTQTLRAGAQSTALFIRPGYAFGVVDQMITNFHTPRSSLLVMVSAFAGYDAIQRAYTEAIEHRYRFYSYGDAMWIHNGK